MDSRKGCEMTKRQVEIKVEMNCVTLEIEQSEQSEAGDENSNEFTEETSMTIYFLLLGCV